MGIKKVYHTKNRKMMPKTVTDETSTSRDVGGRKGIAVDGRWSSRTTTVPV